ncbi:MAG: non-ribosomal peptide synthetase, partial [Bacteroidota bacterium]
QELCIAFEYNDGLLDDNVVAMLKGHMGNVLESIVQGATSLGDIRYMDEEEEHQILKEFNNTTVDYPKDTTIVSLFEKQVQNTPNNIALIFEDNKLTYKELNETANRMAHYLRTNYSTASDDLIAFQMARSEQLVITILGILKSGSAYLPIDKSIPDARVEYILQNSKAKLLITDELTTPKGFQQNGQKQFINIAEITGNLMDNPVGINQSSDLAYVIYTSGSTGEPKGVMIEHSSLVNLAFSMVKEYGLRPEDKVLQFASISFDVSVEEIFPYLICGAGIHIRNDDVLNSTEDLLLACKDWQISILSLPTAYWRQLNYDLEKFDYELPQHIRLVAIGGEAANLETAQSWLKRQGDYPKLINAYGPTEVTVNTTTFDMTSDYMLSENVQSVPIGSPIANVHTYILDENLKTVPLGVTGELCAGGRQVARGYLNLPKLTAQRFIQSPFREGERLYRTGDLARWLPDGNIEYLGRSDGQVKILGHRIELGEIEASLETLANVEKAVVIVRENTAKSKWLIAFLKSDEILDGISLEEELREILPGYMIPRHFVRINAFPLNVNGKIDHHALLELETQVQNDYEAPSTETEERLVAIWSELLEISKDTTSVTESFFRLGGHSLKMLMLLNIIKKEFNVKVKLETFYKKPQIRELGKIILVSSVSANRIEDQSVAKITI